MQYRPEVDGLRAVAVIPVILFHAGFEAFSGGFVGVDVFFVISGYLITTILIEDIENKRFSIVNFYERRARRILPALFFVMLVCIPFAWMWMLPSQMKDFSQSLVAVSLFASNILFWRESGYFDAAAEEKPLLHTWSLAVEEQYYVLFPIFLILTWRFGKNRVFWMIVVIAAISLLLSELGWRNKGTANFYLAPTRAWELFAGSISAFIVRKRGVQKNNLLALVGLAAIIFSIFFYDESTPFPSVYALVPVLGVVLVVLYADKETLAARLLSTKGFVGIGLISYSAYLWHQPLFAFARIRSLENPADNLMLSLTLVSIVLAYFSWRFIEQPFIKKNLFTRKLLFTISGLGILAFCLIGVTGYKNDGFQNRFSYQEIEFTDYLMVDEDGSCFGRQIAFCNKHDTRPKIFVLGDSTMQPITTALESIQTEYAVVPVTAAGCVIIKEYNLFVGKVEQKNCTSERVDYVLNLLKHADVAAVLYGGMFTKILTQRVVHDPGRPWKKQFLPNSAEVSALSDAIIKTVSQISSLSTDTFVMELPEPGLDADMALFRASIVGVSAQEYLSVNRDILEISHDEGGALIEDIKSLANVHAVNALDLLCDGSECLLSDNGRPMFSDHVHPSEAYSLRIANHLMQNIFYQNNE